MNENKAIEELKKRNETLKVDIESRDNVIRNQIEKYQHEDLLRKEEAKRRAAEK